MESGNKKDEVEADADADVGTNDAVCFTSCQVARGDRWEENDTMWREMR